MVTFRDAVVRMRLAVQTRTFNAGKQALQGLAKGAEVVAGAADVAAKSLSGAAKMSEQLGDELDKTRRSIDANRAAMRNLTVQERELRATGSALRRQRRDAEREYKGLAKAIKASGVATKEQDAREKQLRRTLDQTEKELDQNRRATDELAASRRRLAADTGRLRTQSDRLARATRAAKKAERESADSGLRGFASGFRGERRTARQRGEGAREALRGAGRRGVQVGLVGAAAGAAGIAAGLAGATQEAVKFESSFADVKKVLAGEGEGKLDEAGIEQLEKDLIGLSARLPVTAQGLTEITAAAGQAGIATEDLARFTEFAAKGAVAFDTSADEVGTAAAKLRTGLGLTQDEVESLFGSINELSNSFAASAPEILLVEKQVGAVAKTVGFTKEETAALATSLIASGAEARVAATGIKNLATWLGAGASATDKQVSALGKLGLEAEAVAQNLQVDASGTVLDVFDRIAALDAAEQAGVLSDLFTRESIGAIGPLLGQLDTLREALGVAQDETAALTSVQTEYEARAATTANTIQLAKNAVVAFGIGIGKEVLPFVNEAIGDFAKFVSENQGLAQVIGQKVVTALRDLLARIRDFIGPTDQLGDRIGKLVDIFFKLAEAAISFIEVTGRIVDSIGAVETAVLAMTVAVGAALGPWGLLAATGAAIGLWGANVVQSLRGVTAEIRSLSASTDFFLRKAREASAEINRLNDENEAAADATFARIKREREGFGESLLITAEDGTKVRSGVGEGVDRQLVIARRIAEAKGTAITKKDILSARRAASDAFARTGSSEAAEAAAIQSIRNVGAGSARQARPRRGGGGGGRRRRAAAPRAARPERDDFVGITDPDLRRNLRLATGEELGFGAGGELTAGLITDSRRIQNAVDGAVVKAEANRRASLGGATAGLGLGGGSGPAGPNVNQTFFNTEINIDARGQGAEATTGINRAGAALEADTPRLVGILKAKLFAGNAAGARG